MSVYYDIIIVGAGSAGCPLAARLSEDEHRRVLLVDAGPLYRTINDYPPELRDAASAASSTPGHPNNWSFMANVTSKVSYPVARGRVFGGSSALNGTLFNRGVPEDYDGWARLGNDEWSFEKVLPYFRKLETDRDFQDEFHGASGPIPIRRATVDEWGLDQKAFVAACKEAGYRDDPDKNHPAAEGVGAMPVNNIDGIRMNTAVGYILPILDRKSLTVWGDTFVRRVVFDGTKAVGIEVEKDGQTVVVQGGEIILSAGAIQSPHLLMLSGIGPAADLQSVGIPLLRDAPGVGRNFMDHPAVVVHYQTAQTVPSYRWTPQVQTSLQYTACGSDIRSDMEIIPFCGNAFGAILEGDSHAGGIPAWLRHPIRTLMAMRGISIKQLLTQYRQRNARLMTCVLNQPEARGEMRLRSGDPHVHLELNYRYFELESDRKRMREAVRLAVKLIESNAFKHLGPTITAPTRAELESDDRLNGWLVGNALTAYHSASSCRMGDPSEKEAVVDQFCRVIGVEGLRVVDCSIMPRITRRGVAASAVMLGERAADLIKATLSVQPPPLAAKTSQLARVAAAD